jgi:hypothetical protein
MPLSLLLLWAVAGWSATSSRSAYIPNPDDPDPPPWPGPPWWWFASRIIGVVFGIIGGWAYTTVFAPDPLPWTLALPAAASAFGAFLVARVATDIASRFRGGNRA